MPSSLKRSRDTPPLEHPFSASGNKCNYCSKKGHNYDQCMIRIATEKAIAERDRKLALERICQMCEGEHYILDCSLLAAYRNQQYDVDASSDDDLGSGDEYEAKSPTPYSPTSSDPIGEMSSTITCPICYKHHDGSPCSYSNSVPKGAPVSPFFPIVCERCNNAGMDNNLWCPHCKTHATGYVIARINCMVCGKPMSPDCCPYGTLIEKKNQRTGYKDPFE